MKKTSAAAAALLLVSTKLPFRRRHADEGSPLCAAPVANWTGFYIGGHVGAGWGTTGASVTGFPLLVSGGISV